MRLRPPFLSACGSILLLCFCSYSITSCNGNGGSHDGGGAVYAPGGGSGGGSSSGGSGSNDSGIESFTADDLLNLSNSGNADRIIQLVSQTGGAGGQTQTVTMSAADLGLPTGGTVVLTVTGGGISFSGSAGADENGMVSFEVPMLETNSIVTIELTVLDANGNAIFIGSDTQSVDSTGNLEVNLVRQFWTLTPGCIAITATSCSLLYDSASWTTDSTTLSVTGLDAAPAGSSFSYEWKDESGMTVSTDPTLTQTVFELLNGVTPSGDVTRSFTVTVSYTDASGTAVTADASAVIAVGGPVTLPAFSISLTPPDSRDAVSTATSFALTNLSDPVSFSPVAAGGAEFPAGTQFTWTVTMDGHTASRSSGVGDSVAVSLAQLGYTDNTAPASAAPKEFRVSCTASNTRAVTGPVTGTEGAADVYLLYTIPAFTVTVTPPTAPHCVAAKSDTTNKIYALADLNGAFSFTPVPAAGTSFPAGTTFEWTVTMGSSSASRPDTTIIASCTASPSLIGLTDATIGRTSGTATAISVTCKAKNDHAADRNASNSGSTLASAFLLYTIPAFTIDITAPAAGISADNSNAAGKIYAVKDVTWGYTFTATPAGGASFPDGTTLNWTIQAEGHDAVTGTSAAGTRVCSTALSALGLNDSNMGSKASNAKTVTISCTASNDSAAADVEETASMKVFRLTIPAFKIRVTKPDGIPGKALGDGTTKYLVTDSTLIDGGKQFTLTAEPEDSADSFPVGTSFSWKFGSAAYTTASAAAVSQTRTAGAMCGNLTAAPAAQTSYTIYCKASLTGARAEVTADVTVVLAPLSITMKYGTDIGPILRTSLGAGSGGAARSFAASATPPGPGTTTYTLSAADSDVECLAWRDGPDIKYYAEGYTDAGIGLPLIQGGFVFADCEALTSIDVSGLDFSAAEAIDGIFNGCKGLVTLDLSSFNTPNATGMSLVFYECENLTAITWPAAGFDTSSATIMYNMFGGCKSLTALDLSSFNTASLTNMAAMFKGCEALTSLNLSSFNTASVTNMNNTFAGCTGLTTLDLRSFDTNSVTSMEGTFSGCTSLQTIRVSNNFKVDNVTNSTNMFADCSSNLRGGRGTMWLATNPIDKTYARIDSASSPGYFTGP